MYSRGIEIMFKVSKMVLMRVEMRGENPYSGRGFGRLFAVILTLNEG